jgi:hypothetical protein
LDAEPIHAIGHFSCHYIARGPTAQGRFEATPKLVFHGLRGTFDSPKQAPIVVDIDVLSDELYRLAFAPFTALFFLNSCESAAGGNFDNSLLGLLRKRNATAIVGSETLLPDGLAGEFAIEFYRGLLRGVRVGTALLNARRRLLERFGNPVGLFYTFFGNPLMKISEARR